MYFVKIASEDEIRLIGKMSKAYEEEYSSFIEVDVEYATNRYLELVRNGIMIIFALMQDDTVIGGLSALKFPDMNNGKMTAVECFWFVINGQRGKGLMLIDAFEEWAIKQGCKKAALIHLEDSFPDVLKRLYKRKGYRFVESHYVKDLAEVSL